MENQKHKRIPLLLIAVLLAVLLFIAGQQLAYKLRADIAQQSRDSVKQAVLEGAIQCYAVEGAYPPNLEYLEENYGLLVDHAQYVVSYDCFASNVLPDVRVLSR